MFSKGSLGFLKSFLVLLPISAAVIISVAIYQNYLKIKEFPGQRSFEITYGGTFEDIPQDAKQFRGWIPLASSRDGQEILYRNVELPYPYEITKDPDFGNEILYFEVNGPLPESIPFKIHYKASLSVARFLTDNKETDLGLYLQPTKLMSVSDEVLQITDKAIDGRKTFRDKVRGIYDGVINHMRYDKKTPGYGNGDTLRACLMGKGNCTDFHSLFISMAQSAEIPARFKIGFPVPLLNVQESNIAGYHCWAEFYDENKGWQPVDASEAWKHPEKKDDYFAQFDTNKFLINVGRDVSLLPAPSTGPINIFFYPHVEIDGHPFKGFKGKFFYKKI